MNFETGLKRIIARIDNKIGIPDEEKKVIESFPFHEGSPTFSIPQALQALEHIEHGVMPKRHIEVESYVGLKNR